MTLTLDSITLGVPDVDGAGGFYASRSSEAAGQDNSPTINLRGGGSLALHPVESLADEVGAAPATNGFRGYVLSSIVTQPNEVEALLDSAVRSGATLVKPAKKQFFGEFAATYRAPDGAVWKLAAASKKNATPAAAQPTPTENAVYLGVASPKSSLPFYSALGMTVDNDYGDKFIDFTVPEGSYRLGLLPRAGLAKDVGVDEKGEGFAAIVLTHRAPSRDDVDRLLSTAHSSGGAVIAAGAVRADGAYVGTFTDPDGHYWTVTAGN